MKELIDNLVQAVEFLKTQIDTEGVSKKRLAEIYEEQVKPMVETATKLSELTFTKEELVEIVESYRETIKEHAANIIRGNAIHQLITLQMENGGNAGDAGMMVISPDGPIEFTNEMVAKLGETLQKQREAKLRLEKKEQRFSGVLALIEADELTRG